MRLGHADAQREANENLGRDGRQWQEPGRGPVRGGTDQLFTSPLIGKQAAISGCELDEPMSSGKGSAVHSQWCICDDLSSARLTMFRAKHHEKQASHWFAPIWKLRKKYENNKTSSFFSGKPVNHGFFIAQPSISMASGTARRRTAHRRVSYTALLRSQAPRNTCSANTSCGRGGVNYMKAMDEYDSDYCIVIIVIVI